ncbi:jg12469 [Pararge aegeria aegeria]|uniref:Jg12469 protein n=1 Tax=Pararge aegeria aegeria TaxID=348720 RepID=A0A8S4RS31_9NEOP|nr:jg12469 [Pararge aegeria aegeria]
MKLFRTLRDLFFSKIPQFLKTKVLEQCVPPVLTYGSETWSVTVGLIKRHSAGDGESYARTNKIEVINTRPTDKQDFDINEILKSFEPPDSNSTSSENNSAVSISQKSQDALPGLDLLTPDSTGNPPPPTSFYGTMETIVIPDEPDTPYLPEALTTNQWSNASWSVPPPAPASHIQPVVNPRSIFAEPPASPPPALHPAPHPVPAPLLEPRPQDPPAADVDHRGILPPPPPPPVLPLLGHIEDVDHRMLPALQPPPVPLPSVRHAQHQDVDHRNLIPLTHQLPVPPLHNPMIEDRDYRVPTMLAPTDITESVDMDLSEDEEQQGMYSQNQIQHHRHSFNNNNKVLVGGDIVKQNHNEKSNSNLIQINSISIIKDGSHSAPSMPPLSNPFDNMPDGLKYNIPQTFQNKSANSQNKQEFKPPPEFQNNQPDSQKQQNFANKPSEFISQLPTFPLQPELKSPPILPNNQSDSQSDQQVFEEKKKSNVSAYEEDLRNRTLNKVIVDRRNSSSGFEDFTVDSDWSHSPRPLINQRFPRNWGPRTNHRAPGFMPPFWPRNGPRPPIMGPRWGPRPQRFW